MSLTSVKNTSQNRHWLTVLVLSCVCLVNRSTAAPEGFSVRTWQIPDGSTIFDMNAADPNKKPEEKKAPPPEADNSKRAAEILRKYMQRPRT